MMLAQLQRDMQAFLASGSLDSAARVSPHGAGLTVYQNNYRAQLVGCLEQTYPHLKTFMGAEAFHYAAVSHIGRRPPQAWTLDAYGAHFGATLGELFPDNPDLHELAWIEWALGLAFIARDAAPLSAAALAGAEWDSAGLVFSPSLAVAPVRTNAADIWDALQAGEAAPEAAMLEHPAGVVVWRRGFTTCLRVLDADERDAFASASAACGFSLLCASLAERHGQDAGIARAGALLANWLSSEMVVDLIASEEVAP